MSVEKKKQAHKLANIEIGGRGAAGRDIFVCVSKNNFEIVVEGPEMAKCCLIDIVNSNCDRCVPRV